jgi:hypothetical protein
LVLIASAACRQDGHWGPVLDAMAAASLPQALLSRHEHRGSHREIERGPHDKEHRCGCGRAGV